MSTIEQEAPQNAASVAQKLLEAIDSLELLPRRDRIHEHRKDPAKTVRSVPVPPFIIYCRVLDRHNVVEVLAVRHGSRRQPRHFR
ncbi:MAG: type II toxin-antitoxin system RelE/ParE family toxin [Phycisphaerae bacterium]|nr:type II toxin-antitoxin system RelE/ParE family toxin [Phycisphaerae bacterium]